MAMTDGNGQMAINDWRRFIAAIFAAVLVGLSFAADGVVSQVPDSDVGQITRSASQPVGHLTAPSATQPASQAVRPRDDPRVIGWTRTLFWSLVLFLILGAAVISLAVFSSRYKAYLRQLTTRRRATPSEDVWSMHRAPMDDESDIHGDNGD